MARSDTITDRGLHATKPHHSECALHLRQRSVGGIESAGQTLVRSGPHRPWCRPHNYDPQPNTPVRCSRSQRSLTPCHHCGIPRSQPVPLPVPEENARQRRAHTCVAKNHSASRGHPEVHEAAKGGRVRSRAAHEDVPARGTFPLEFLKCLPNQDRLSRLPGTARGAWGPPWQESLSTRTQGCGRPGVDSQKGTPLSNFAQWRTSPGETEPGRQHQGTVSIRCRASSGRSCRLRIFGFRQAIVHAAFRSAVARLATPRPASQGLRAWQWFWPETASSPTRPPNPDRPEAQLRR